MPAIARMARSYRSAPRLRFPLTPALSLREREQIVPADTWVSPCAERSPLPLGEG
jgi:hypothetical protein